jgi:hypothetical protein
VYVHISHLQLAITDSQTQVGGMVFPIMLRRLFESVGFAWAVRIFGFICLACCVVATVTVTSKLPTRKPDPWIDVSSFRDIPFVFLAIGSVLVFIGKLFFQHLTPSISSCDDIITGRDI